ncbi:MAG: ATP-dependent helicase/nuclease subunit B, partial [Gammaproteobacteria bacterium]
ATSWRADAKLALVGFDDIPPQQGALLNTLTKTGVEVREVVLQKRNRQVVGTGFVDVRDEINACANWIRKLLHSHQSESIGIVVPNLQKLRTQIRDQFDDVLLPGGILESSDPSSKPYSISLGQGLNTYPIIATAFAILELVEQPFSIKALGALLRSSFVKGGHEEQMKRSLLDANLREYGEQYVSLSTLLFIAQKKINGESQCPIFLSCLEEWQSVKQNLPNSQSAHDWASSFSALLTIFNWPGNRPLSSAEYQTMAAWQELLTQFVSLDVVVPHPGYRTALTHLRQLAAAFSFQPETAEVPVQVMGHTGAAGMHFEHLWILGLHEDSWPAPSEPNPFISLSLQVQHKVTNASAKNRLAYTRQVTEGLLHSSPDVVLSYPQHDKERPLRPSPLIKAYVDATDKLEPERLPAYSKKIFDSSDFEYTQDDEAPAISKGQRVSGGTGLFKDQAACAFRAFARHRLHAHSLMEADIGLDPMERGSLLHDLMQILWGKLSGHAALMALTSAEQNSLIEVSIDTAIMSYKKQRPQTFTERFITLEKQRLKVIVEQWLEIERQRQSFKVAVREDKYVFSFADIEVHTRIDRIDEIDDGRLVIIDYKTGNVSVNAWFDARPDDPQLPLYAITSKGDIAAIVFAKVKRGESQFVGIANGEDIIPAVKSFEQTNVANEMKDWQGLLNHWEQVLLQIGDDFRQGKAEVNPKNASTCRYCDLHAFCRIYELSATSMDELANTGQDDE